jgi:hypothetical protein
MIRTSVKTAAFAILSSAVWSLSVAAPLQITSLGTANSILLEHQPVTGDDRGGIAVGSNLVIYTGDNSSGRFSATDLSGGTALGVQYDSITSDVGSGTIWSLGSDATTPIPYGGGTVTHLLRHNATTGLLDGTAIALSAPVSLSNSGSQAGIFAGNGVIAVVDGTTRAITTINTTTGAVTSLGTVNATVWTTTRSTCESWSTWGVFEEFGGQQYLAFAAAPFAVQTIVRYRISDGNVSTIASFTNPGLSDACSFSVSPSRNRWYVHYEGGGVFGGNDESLIMADAAVTFTPVAAAPTSIPTLSEWGMIILSSLLALGTVLVMRRQRL